MTLQLAPGFALPDDAATGTFGVLATKGAGKSNAAVVMAEELYDAGIPWVAIDPKGDWYGIRSSADGKGPGLPIVVFGGRHGDVPLEPTAGALIADLVLAQRLTCVLDVSQFTKADTTRFLLAFGRRLFAHADDNGAEPLHLFLEEAHEYLPQVVKGDQAELVNVWQRIVKQGRFKGLGCTMISQRSSVLNKDVLELIDTLIVLRTIGPRSRDSIKAWVQDQDVDPKLMASLPSLADGEAWVWSPGALNVLERVRFRRRRTFDSGATPKVGQPRKAPATLADVDLAAIKEQMAETIEKAKADDPKELHKRIRELEGALRVAQSAIPEPVVEYVEVPVLIDVDADRLVALTQPLSDLADRIDAAMQSIAETVGRVQREQDDDRKDLPRARAAGDGARTRDVAARQPAQRPDPPARREPRGATIPRAEEGDLNLGKAERAIIAALVQKPTADAEQLALLAGYHQRSKGYTNALGSLRSAGLLDGIRLTDAGWDAADALNIEPIADLWSHWYNHPKVDGAGRKILDALVTAWPAGLDRAALADVVGYHERSKGFTNALGRVRSLELVTRGTQIISLTDEFGEAIS